MGTIEKLFVQIFERKKWIEDQVKRQTLLFDQQLASKCLLDGIAPPPWLFPSFPNELNKEELITGLLLPCPQVAVPYPVNCYSIYNKPTVSADKGDLPDSFFTEVGTSYKGFNAGDRLSVSPQLPVNDVGGTSNGVQKGDSSAAISLPDQEVERLSDVSPEPAQSLENFPRSKSRQRALALRNSAKLVGSNLRDENNAGVLAGGITGSEIATLQHDHIQELEFVEPINICKESCKVEEGKLGKFQGKGNESHVEELISPLILSPQPAASYSRCECSPYYKPATISENDELPDASNKEVHTLSKGLVAEDGLSNLHQFTVNDAGFVSNGMLKMDFGAESPQDQRSLGTSDIDPEPLQSLARVQRSKSRQRALEVRNSANAEKSYLSLENDICEYSSVVTGSGITSPQSDQIGKSELIKCADFDNESCEVVGTKVYDYHSKENSSDIHFGRISRSQKSVQQPRESSNAGYLSYAGRSSRYHNSEGCPKSSKEHIEYSASLGAGFGPGMVRSSPPLKQRKVGGRLTNALSAALSLRDDNVMQSNEKSSPIGKMDRVDELVAEGSKSSPVGMSPLEPNQIHESELVKTPDNDSCQVEGAEVYDNQIKEKSSTIYSGRIMISRSSARQPSSMRESSHAGKLAYAGRSSRTGNSVGCPESSEQRIEENLASLGRGFCSVIVDSSPQLKQRKVGGILTDVVSASPSLRDDDVVQSNGDRSPVDKMDHEDKLVAEGSKSSPVGMSPLQPDQIHESESVKTTDIDNESCQVEGAEVFDNQSKEKSGTVYSGTITISQSSAQQSSSMRESSPAFKLAYAGRSSRTGNNVGFPESSEQIEENLAPLGRGFCSVMVDSSPQLKQKKVGGRLTDVVSASPSLRDDDVVQSNEDRSPVNKMDQEEKLMTNRSKSSPRGISSLEPDQIHESESVKTADFDNESCQVEGADVYGFQSKEKRGNIYSGRITRSRSSVQQPSSMREPSHAGSLYYAERSTRTDNSVRCPESSEQQIEENFVSLGGGFGFAVVGSSPHFKQGKVGGGLTDPVPTSPSLRKFDVVQSNEDRSPVDKMDLVEQPVTKGSKPSPIGISSLEPDQIHESEVVKTVDFDKESFEVGGAKAYDFRSKEKSSNKYSGRINRSRSSVRQPGSMRESSHAGSHAYAGRSSRDDNNVGCPESSEQQIEEISTTLIRGFGYGMVDSSPQLKQRDVGGGLTDAMFAGPSLREDDVVQSNDDKSPAAKMDSVKQLMTEGSKSSPVGVSSLKPESVYELELRNPADSYFESCVVKEADVGDIQIKENSSNAGSERITLSQTPSQQHIATRDSLNARRSGSEDKIAGSYELRQKSGKKSILQGNNFSRGAEDSWPQHKRRKVEGQASDHRSASLSLREEGVSQSGVNKSLVVEMDQNGDCKMKQEFQSSNKMQVDEDKPSSEERDGSAKNTPFTFVQKSEMPLISSFINQPTGDPKACSDAEAAVPNTTGAILDPDKQCAMGRNEVLLYLDDKFELGNTEHLSLAERGMLEGTCHLGGNGISSQCSIGSPQRQTTELLGADQVMPEFEGFIMETDNGLSSTAGEGINLDELDLPKTTMERASVLEQLCKCACMQTKLSCFSTTYKLHQAPNLCQSVPNGLLECIDQRIYSSTNNKIVKQLKASYSCFDVEANHAFQGRSYSDCLPFSSAQPASDIRKPLESPIGKFWDRITSNSASSEKRGSSNSELPCISEENENTYEVADAFQEGISSEVTSPVRELWDWTASNSSSSEKRDSLNLELPFISEEDENTDMVAGVHQSISSQVVPTSAKRKKLADITKNPNLSASVSNADIFAARSSLESLKTEFNFSGTCNSAKQKYGHHTSNKKKHTRQAKMSHGTSLGENGINRVSHNRFSKPKLSGKPSLRKGGPSFADRETKHNNIVSNVTSFIPLVQQKQAAAIITGKRDVKVKALEAAEAAKRLAEEKENERKRKKEALKLERAKLEKENLKQLELQKKKKEEERKKKESDMAARKRQREEEERKEKERKRKRVVEARKQQQENEEKLQAKKEERKKKEADVLVGERLNLTKVSTDETWKDNKRVKEQGEENLGKILTTESKATVVSTSDARETSIVLQVCEPSTDYGDKSKATSHLEKATENDLVSNQNQEPSYDISPYKDSDDEEEEDDDRPNTKFVPSWASKRSSAMVISSLQSVNPEVIFPQGSFCSISEVLLPRSQQLNRKL